MASSNGNIDTDTGTNIDTNIDTDTGAYAFTYIYTDPHIYTSRVVGAGLHAWLMRDIFEIVLVQIDQECRF